MVAPRLFGNHFLCFFVWNIACSRLRLLWLSWSAGGLHLFCSASLLCVAVLFRLLSFVSLLSCAGLHSLVLGSEVTVVFVGVACDELSGNKQMAHSQIVVVIAFS